MNCITHAARRHRQPHAQPQRSNTPGNPQRAHVFSGMALTALLLYPALTTADTLQAVSLADGYEARSIELGVPYGGSIAVDPDNPRQLYVSAGNFGEQTLLTVNTDTGATHTLSPVIGNIGGLAVLTNGDLAISENLASETILRARDLDADGAYFSTGEITELIAPILADANFTGAHLVVAPPNNAAQIPAGSLIVQTADGGNLSELLVIRDPETSPAYYPPGAAWFDGFTYNGGVAFAPAGDVLCGISEFPVGRVEALVNANGNNQIDAGESHELLGADVLINSISDLTASGDGKLMITENGGNVRWFDLPADLADGSIETSGVLVETNGGYLSSVRIDSPERPFTPGSAWPVATVYVGGFVTYLGATNLLAISPVPAPAAARDWSLFQ